MVEVFMVITLLAIAVGVFVVPAHRIADSLQARPVEAVLLSAVREAHMQARRRNAPVLLSYLSDTNRLQLHARDGTLIREFETGRNDDSAPALRFYRLLPEDPERGETVYEPEEDPVDAITFHPCGSSTPFCADIEDRRTRIRLVMDPFSSRPVSREEEP